MAHSQRGLAAAWEDAGSSYGNPTPYDDSPRRGHQGGIPPEAQPILERAFTTNPYLSPRDISLIATRTRLEPDTIRDWFSKQAYRLSDRSDPTTTAPLPPLDPVSVQSDIQYTSGWLENKADHVVESGAHGHPPAGLNTHQYLDPANHSASTSLLNVATDAPIDPFSFEAAPWVPGSRTAPPDDSVHLIYPLPVEGKSHRSLTENDGSSYNVEEGLKPDATSASLRPGSVSSDAKGSTRSRHKTSANTQGGVTTCTQCGKEFTGTYQRGNSARHIRQQHSENATHLSLDCICRICGQLFKRQDAKRKHEWNKHSLPDAKPIPRRPGASTQGGSSHVGAYETGSDHETVTNAPPEEPITGLRYQVPPKVHHAHTLFYSVHMSLGKDIYHVYCRTFLAQCERVDEELRRQQSDLCYAFALELDDISMALLPKQRNLSSASENYIRNAQSNIAPEYDATGGYSGRGKAPVSRRTSRASTRTHPYSGRPNRKSMPGSPSNAALMHWDEDEMKREATRDILISRAYELLAQFQAEEYATAAHEHINVEGMKDRIRARLEELRILYYSQVNNTYQPDHDQFTHQTLTSTLPMHPAPTPIISGANDFPAPSTPTHSFLDKLQMPSSDNGTHSISQEYHISDTSPGFHSFAASSQTSFDFSSYTFMDTSQFAGSQFTEATACPVSPHNNTTWPSPYETYLDVPCDSRLPQNLLAEEDANAQMFPELDHIMAEGEEARYAMSSYAPEDEM